MTAAVLRELMAAGLFGEALLAAVERIEVADVSTRHPPDSRVDKRRVWDREYRRRKRNYPPDIHPNPPDIPPDTEIALLLPSLLSNSIKEESKKEEFKKERARAAKIPPDWHPTEFHFAAGRKLGFSDEQIVELAEDMRLWALANAHRAVARKLDWGLTFLAWMRRNKPKESPNGGKSGSLVAAIDKMRAKLASGQNEDFVHLLPDRPIPGPGSVHAPDGDGLGGLRPADRGDSHITIDGDSTEIEIPAHHRGTG